MLLTKIMYLLKVHELNPNKCCSNVLPSFTSRISELMNVLDDLNQGRYERSMVSSSSSSSLTEAAVTESKLFSVSYILINIDSNTFFEINPLRLQYVILRTQFQSRCDYDT